MHAATHLWLLLEALQGWQQRFQLGVPQAVRRQARQIVQRAQRRGSPGQWPSARWHGAGEGQVGGQHLQYLAAPWRLHQPG